MAIRWWESSRASLVVAFRWWFPDIIRVLLSTQLRLKETLGRSSDLSLEHSLLSGAVLCELQPCLLWHSHFCHINLERWLDSFWVSLCHSIVQKASRWSAGIIEELIPFVFYLAEIMILHGLMPNVLKTIFSCVFSPVFYLFLVRE